MSIRRIVLPASAEPLPLQLETIGINPDQEPIRRPNGYPGFHWLHTLEGEGELETSSAAWRMPPHTGILLAPGMPHRYAARGAGWRTAYITFHGSLAAVLTSSFRLQQTGRYVWEPVPDRLTQHLISMLEDAEAGLDPSGWHASSQLYRFLALLRTDARTDHRPSITSRFERIDGLLRWLDEHLADPGIGLAEMAGQLHISTKQLGEMFRQLFGMSAYAYLIQLRLRRAKEMLPAFPHLTIRQVGQAVGFRDASHFNATFRRHVGMTPDTYRKLHRSGKIRDET